MADTLSTISFVSFLLAGVFLAVTIALFFLFKIPSVWGDLSGRSARKSIKKMRAANEKTGKKEYGSKHSDVKSKKRSEIVSANGETGLLKENYKQKYEGEGTGILGELTEALGEEATTILQENAGNVGNRVNAIAFEYIEDVMLIHTEEVI